VHVVSILKQPSTKSVERFLWYARISSVTHSKYNVNLTQNPPSGENPYYVFKQFRPWSEGSLDHICDVISEKGTLLRNKQYNPRLAVFTLLRQYFWLTLHMSDKNVFFRCSCATNVVGPDQIAAGHFARLLIRAYDICSAIRYLFADDVTYSAANLIEFASERDKVSYGFLSGPIPYTILVNEPNMMSIPLTVRINYH